MVNDQLLQWYIGSLVDNDGSYPIQITLFLDAFENILPFSKK